MRRILLFCVGAVLGLLAGLILWNAPELYLFTDSWHSAAFTRAAGVSVIVQGALAALWAALCLGRAAVPLTPAAARGGTAAPNPAPAAPGGGPVLPLCGLLFLIAAGGPFGQALSDSNMLDVMTRASRPWPADVVEGHRSRERTEWAFAVLWLVVGGGLLATLLLRRRVWQLGWQMNGAGWGIAAAGFLLSGLGAFACYANGPATEGANKDLNFAGYLGVLAGAALAFIGSITAVAGRSKASAPSPPPDDPAVHRVQAQQRANDDPPRLVT